MAKETWRPVLGFEARYEVSNIGRVRSVPQVQPGRKVCWSLDTVNRPGLRKEVVTIEIHRRGKVLSPKITADGYRVVNLHVNGRPSTRSVHRLVLEAFAGPPQDPTWQTGHLNGKPGDNRLENLAWVTNRQNAAHRILHGTNKYRAKIDLKRRAVQALARGGFTPFEIAACLTLRELSVQRQLAEV